MDVMFLEKIMRALAFLVVGSLLQVTAAQATEAVFEPSVEAGFSYSKVTTRFGGSTIPADRSDYQLGAHFGAGIHRLNDNWRYGIRLQFDQMDDFTMISLRPLDFEYLLTPQWSVGMFGGVRRLDLDIPAYGYVVGGGARYRDLFTRGLDLVVDASYGDKIARDKVLPGDPPINEQAEIFYDIFGTQLYLSWRF